MQPKSKWLEREWWVTLLVLAGNALAVIGGVLPADKAATLAAVAAGAFAVSRGLAKISLPPPQYGPPPAAPAATVGPPPGVPPGRMGGFVDVRVFVLALAFVAFVHGILGCAGPRAAVVHTANVEPVPDPERLGVVCYILRDADGRGVALSCIPYSCEEPAADVQPAE